MAHEKSAREELSDQISSLLEREDVTCRARAALAVSKLDEDVCRSWLRMPEKDKRATLLAAAGTGRLLHAGSPCYNKQYMRALWTWTAHHVTPCVYIDLSLFLQ
jgi:hypothetical protein